MGMSIDIDVVDIEKFNKLADSIVVVSDGKLKPSELSEKAFPKFGIVINGLFVCQTSDYWDDYCPWYQVQKFFDRYYCVDTYKVFSGARVAWRYEGANADEVADELEIELPEEEEEE